MKAPFNFRSFSGYFLSLFCLLVMAFAFGSCKKETQEEELIRKIKEEDEKSIQAYLEHHHLADSAVRTASGIYYIIETKTEGEQAVKGKTVEVDYIGKFLNGNTFDSSYANGRSFIFKVGQGDVIAGWDEGIALMKEGEKFKLLIPSGLAYGLQGRGNVPPNAILVFDTWLRDVR